MARRILIVDDNPNVRSALRMIFSHNKNWVVCGEAADGQQAVAMADKLAPDAILLDFRMPGLNGLEAATQILQRSPLLPIILYSLNEISTLEKHAKEIGIAKVISKVDVFTSLIGSLEEAVPGTLAAPVGSVARTQIC